MQTTRIFLAVVIMLFLSGCTVLGAAPAGGTAAVQAASAAQSDAGNRTIRVNGEASVMVEPDEVILTLGVETKHMQLKTARQKNEEVVQKAVGIARETGIEARYIQTDYINIEPLYTDYNQKVFDGYFVRQNLVLTLKDITRFEGLLTSLLDAGVTNVHGIQFRTSELRKYRDQARALAIQAAQEKAGAMAAVLEQGVGEPTSIEEGYGGWYSWYDSWWGSRYGGMTQNVIQNAGPTTYSGDTSLAPGQIAITANVTVEFELE